MKIKYKLRKVWRKFATNNTRNIDSIREIDYENLKKLIEFEKDLKIVDIRSPQEFEERRIRYAINIPLYDLNKKATYMLPDKNKIIILYCGCGIRSKKAYKILEKMGYTNLYSLKGGISDI